MLLASDLGQQQVLPSLCSLKPRPPLRFVQLQPIAKGDADLLEVRDGDHPRVGVEPDKPAQPLTVGLHPSGQAITLGPGNGCVVRLEASGAGLH